MSGTPLRFGLLRLADSAPALVAQAHGLFAAAGLEVSIQVEPSWANILDKLTWGLLEAAIVMPPLALAACLGLRGSRAGLLVPAGLTSGGNSVVVGQGAWPAVHAAGTQAEKAAALLAWMRARTSPPRFGVVHLYSTHNLLLRHWLAGAGGVAERDWQTVVVPPERTADALAEGGLAGFCAGAPWGEVAEASGDGHVLLGASELWPGQPEKCLAVTTAWANANQAALGALTNALLEAGAICNDPRQAGAVAALLAGIGLPKAPANRALAGGPGREAIRFAAPGNHIGDADPAHARWFLRQMQANGWVAANAGAVEAAALYRRGAQDARHDLALFQAQQDGMPLN